MKQLILILCLLSVNSLAEESMYKPYLKLSTGYILSQPDKMGVSAGEETPAHEIKLYTGDKINYSIDTGIEVSNGFNSLSLGLSWSDLLNQGETRNYNRPYILEVFADYRTNYNKWFIVVGSGFKLMNQSRVKDTMTCDSCYIETDRNIVFDNLTARLSIGYNITQDVEMTLSHHSQWLRGRPFDTQWEYHNTSITVSYLFN